MALVVAYIMADRQIFQVAAPPFAQRLDMLQGCRTGHHMLTANPAGHHAMHLPSDRFVDLVTRVGKFAHGRQCTSRHPLNPELGPN